VSLGIIGNLIEIIKILFFEGGDAREQKQRTQ
jgi:hypothetical protein